MRLDIEALRQQQWRAEKLFDELRAYAKSIGCNVIHDEIMCNEEQSGLLARWWSEHT